MMIKADVNQNMIDGYLDGFEDDRPEFPDSLSNRGAAYRHGWINGRNDRLHVHYWPSLKAAELTAEEAIAKDWFPN